MRFPSHERGCAFVLLLICLLFGCGASDAGNASGGQNAGECTDPSCDPDGGLNGGGSNAGTTGASNGSGTSGGTSGANTGDTTGGTNSVVECAKVEVEARPEKQPVDIIWVIDSSGSMDNEAKTVQDNMNSFAQTIASSGLDYRVVVITKKGFVNVPNPLGSDAARFLFVDEDVSSNEPLDALLRRFDAYRGFLRQTAATHFVAVTDDEARKEGGLFGSNRVEQTRNWFVARMTAFLGHTFHLHAVASEKKSGLLGITTPCNGAAAPGEVYYAIADNTAGLKFSICSNDWTPLFANLATAVIQSSGISCDIPMPPPPPGLLLNPEQISISLTNKGSTSALSRVPNEAGCATGGWYFDRPLLPRFIKLCPTSCETAKADQSAKLNVTADCGANACAGVSAETDVRETPVDIVWVVDSSGSMNNEAKIVQDNLNEFAADIAKSGIDYRVVVVTKKDFVFVPNPLGADANHFRFIEESVGSNEPLDDLLKRFDGADGYGSFLRANAITHFIVVTDDEAHHQGANAETTRDWFKMQMEQKLGHPFTLHAIASENVSGKACSGAASPGLTYASLSTKTMGQFYSICTADWSPLFNGLVQAVLSSAPIQCDFALPPPPMGQKFDKDSVNVIFASPGAGAVTIVGRTTSADQCDKGGWHYDDEAAPSRIVLCASTCSDVRKEFDSAIDIQLGCSSELIAVE